MKKETSKATASVSLGKSKEVRGHVIHRLPLGAYLEMIEMIKDMPQKLIEACFPGMNAMQILAQLKTIDAAMLSDIAVRAMTAAPAQAVRLLSHCTGIDEKILLEDKNIGLDGAAEMIEAIYELNQIGNFMQAAARLAAKAKESTTLTNGSKG